MGQFSNALRQEEDKIGHYEDHIQEIIKSLEYNFKIENISIETPLLASQALNNINSMLTILNRKKHIVNAAKRSLPF